MSFDIGTTGLLLGLAGIAFQFLLRQFKAIPEWLYWCFCWALTSLVYWLVTPTPYHAAAWRADVVAYLLWLSPAMLTVRGGSSVADAGARAIASRAGDRLTTASAAVRALVPVTNSKGESPS